MHPDRDEQLNLDFDSIGYIPEGHFHPPSTSRIVLPKTRGRDNKLLGYMQGLAARLHKGEIDIDESYQTKAQLAEMLHPDFYDLRNQQYKPGFIYDDRSAHNTRMLLEEKHRREVTKAIGSLDKKIRRQLHTLDNEKQQLDFLKNKAQLLVRVGTTKKRASIYAYHGSDFPQPMEILGAYREWAIEHQYMQSAPLRLSNLLYRSATNPEQLQLSFDTDFDDLEIDDLEENI